MATTEVQPILNLNAIDIRGDRETGLVSLTDLHKASGLGREKAPNFYYRLDTTSEFLQALAEKLNAQICALWKSKRGKHLSGTVAHWQVALAYAKWLSPELHILVNEGFREWAEEQADPGLKIDRAITRWQEQGREQRWIEDRIKGKLTRTMFVDALKERDCGQFVVATQLVTQAATGKGADQIKKEAGKSIKGASARDLMDRRSLRRLELIESEICETLAEEGAVGDLDVLAVVSREAKRFKEFFGTGKQVSGVC